MATYCLSSKYTRFCTGSKLPVLHYLLTYNSSSRPDIVHLCKSSLVPDFSTTYCTNPAVPCIY